MADYNALIDQYKKKLRNGATGTDYSSLYETAADAMLNAQNASYQSRVHSLNEMLPQIKEDHDAARTDAYENARISAVRNNEALAALGLAGNLQTEYRSGVSETSRIAEDNALRQNINQLNANQLKEEAEVRQSIIDAEYDNSAAVADILADYAENAYNNMLFEEEKKQTAIQNAMKEISVFGRIMTQEAADALGLPVGTMSYQVAQKENKKTGSTKSSSKLSEKVQSALDGAKQRMNIDTTSYSAAYNASLYGISASELPAYQANQYLNGLVRQHTITEKQAEKVKGILGI